MKKKIMIILIIVIAISAGVGYFLLGNSEKEEPIEVEKNWNPYAYDKKYNKTLNDFLISAVEGFYVVKMTVTLEFVDKESLEKFEGKSEPSEILGARFESDLPKSSKVKIEKNIHNDVTKVAASEEEKPLGISPMEIQINTLISTFMMDTTEEILLDKKLLEEKMKNYLNQHLGLEKDIIQKIYIENYIVQ